MLQAISGFTGDLHTWHETLSGKLIWDSCYSHIPQWDIFIHTRALSYLTCEGVTKFGCLEIPP